MSIGFLDAVIEAPPIGGEFNALAQGFRRIGESKAPATPWPGNRAAWLRRHKKYRQHQRKISQGETVLEKLQGFTGARVLARTLSYLRKIDPYVFEELILCALERQGIAVIRNESYSGDGGMDGEFIYQGRRFLVQAKRYEGAISAQHAQDFAALVAERGQQGGLFIHTGRTPPGVYRGLRASQKITLVSGQKLLDLIRGQALALWEAA
jgi:restriction system protein